MYTYLQVLPYFFWKNSRNFKVNEYNWSCTFK